MCGSKNCQGDFFTFSPEDNCCTDKCMEGATCCSEEFPCDVSCGRHKAQSCAACPQVNQKLVWPFIFLFYSLINPLMQGHGAKWCNGDCVWKNEQCEPWVLEGILALPLTSHCTMGLSIALGIWKCKGLVFAKTCGAQRGKVDFNPFGRQLQERIQIKFWESVDLCVFWTHESRMKHMKENLFSLQMS